MTVVSARPVADGDVVRTIAGRWSTVSALALVVVLVIGQARAHSSVLGTIATGMPAGTWATVSTLNIGPTFRASGASGNHLGYAESLVWNPASREAFYIGGDHGDLPRFVRYSEATNTWSVLPRPYWFSTDPSTPMHGYDHTAINVAAGQLYHRPFSSEDVYVYNIAAAAWAALPPVDILAYSAACCGALEYFPEVGGLVFVQGGETTLASGELGGGVFLFDEQTRSWSRLARDLPMQRSNFARYNPVHKVLFFGADQAIYKLTANRRVTRLRDAPVTLGVESSIVTVDPTSGDYLVFTSDQSFYVYDITRDAWTRRTGPISIFDAPLYTPPVHGIIATPISTHGVVLFVKCYHDRCTVQLHKHLPRSLGPGGALPKPKRSTS